MDALAEEFVAWVMAPERTLDEAFSAEILIEAGLIKWKDREKIPIPDRGNFDLERERRRGRRLNPAHRQIFSEIDVKRAAEFVNGFTRFDHWTFGEDRPVRDLAALRFCPLMKDLHLAPTELDDLAGLRDLPELEHLWLQDEILDDFSGLRSCPKLKTVHLWLGFPWCDLRALAELPELNQVTLHGNLPMLAGVGTLPKVTKVLFNGWGSGRAPVQDGHALPDMPALREAQISPIASLVGVEKYAALEDVTFEGPYKSIEPLAALAELRKLVLGGERYRDLSPVGRMPALAVLHLAREFPLDYTVLLMSDSLRELRRCGDKPLTPEQAGINAALGGWDYECLLPTPRPLPRPVYRFIQTRGNPPPGFDSPVGVRAEPVPLAVAEAQGTWLAARLDRALTRKYGGDWGETYSHSSDASRGRLDVVVHDIEIADQMSDLIDLLRHELAWLRDGWAVDLRIDPKSQWQRDPEAWKDEVEADLEERIQQARDYSSRRRDYLAFLERLRVYQERQELGEETLPEEFAPPAEKEAEPDSDLLEPTESGADESWEADDHPKWADYFMTVEVCEEGVWVPVGYRRPATRLLMHPIEKFPDWDKKHDEEEDV
ncbi:MAG TPA: hypothetical protein VGG02_05705 [Chthoniobacterales bacterium]|jgi:hypothetical protein